MGTRARSRTPTWTASGKFGPGLVFNGTNAKVTIPDAATLHLSSAMTLEAWVKPASVTPSWRDVIYKGDDNYFLEAVYPGGGPAAGVTTGSSDAFAGGSAALPVNTWSHIAATYDGANIRLYVNGVQVASQARTGTIAGSSNPLQIGGDAIYGQYFNGTIDEARIYSTALTAAQIQSDMTTPVGIDSQAPTAPTNLLANAVSGTQVNLTWTASTDNVGVSNYLIERCQGAGCSNFTQIATSTTAGFNNTGLTAGNTYSYRVRATDASSNLSPYSNTATATTPAQDGQPPTAPSNLTATAASAVEIDLAWTAATDNVSVNGYRIERCQGASCTTFNQIGTTNGTTTTYNDTNLTPGTSYSYRVLATDPSGNQSPYSNTATNTTPADTQPPTVPANLTASPIGSGRIDLAWSASTDNLGVTGYRVERCQGAGCSNFAEVGTASTNAFSDTGLTPSTSYSYRVRATDAAANLSGYSNVASGTTQPAVIAGLVASYAFGEGAGTTVADSSGNGHTGTVANTAWTASGKFGPALVFNGTNAKVTIPDAATLHLSSAMTLEAWVKPASVTPSWRDVIYKGDDNYFLEAVYPGGGPAGGVTTGSSDAFAGGSAALPVNTWSHIAATYDGANIRLYVNGVQVASQARTGTIAGSSNPLQIGGDAIYGQYFNGTIDEARIYSTALTAAQIQSDMTTPVGIDSQAPTAPTNLLANAVSGTQVNLTWTASTDNVGVSNYLIERCQGAGCSNFTQIATSTTAGFNNTGLTAGNTYSYRVRATDASSNLSPYSNTATATTPAQDGQPPTAPSNLTATAASAVEIDLAWTAATDNVSVNGYRIERCQGASCTTFNQIGTTNGTTTTYNDTNLTPGTSYSYRVLATDPSGNQSPYSNTATNTTPADTQPPTVPGTLSAAAASSSQIDLVWGPATDDVGVTGYRVDRCQGAGCSNFSHLVQLTGPQTTYSDTGLTPATSYSYQVRAMDAAGNLGPVSNSASATTSAVASTLVAAYAFDEGSGTTVADSSGNGNNGTVANGTWTANGKFGPALVFNGTSTRVTVPDSASLDLASGMTLEAWINPANNSPAWRDVIYKPDDTYFLEGVTPDGTPGVGATLNTGHITVSGSTSAPVGAWTFLAATYDGTSIRLYVNGDQVSSTPATGSIKASSSALQIGGDSLYGQFFNGMIDEARIYDTALTTAQIQADMSTGISYPSAPNGLSAAAVSPSQVDLSWLPATDHTGITGYRVERCQGAGCSTFTQIATPTGTTFSDTGLAANTSYSYRVRAVNTAGKLGAYSNTATAFTGLVISPRTATLTFTRTQQFVAQGGAATWSVDGVNGGTASTGTVTSNGLYTPPTSAGTHIVTATAGSQSVSATVYVSNYPGIFTFHNNTMRTGANTTETVLTPANVNTSTFGKLFTFQTDGIAHASPLYVANLAIPGQGFHNVVYVATEHDSVYAFDADGQSSTPIWKRSFINPGSGVTTVTSGDVGECCDITPEIGITSTPVIDTATNTMYVVVKTKETVGSTTNFVQRLHALDITTGAEKFGGPVVIQGTVPGTGDRLVGRDARVQLASREPAHRATAVERGRLLRIRKPRRQPALSRLGNGLQREHAAAAVHLLLDAERRRRRDLAVGGRARDRRNRLDLSDHGRRQVRRELGRQRLRRLLPPHESQPDRCRLLHAREPEHARHGQRGPRRRRSRAAAAPAGPLPEPDDERRQERDDRPGRPRQPGTFQRERRLPDRAVASVHLPERLA